MRKFGLMCAFTALASILSADPIPHEEYKQRRAELRKTLDGPVVLFGYTEGSDEVYRIGQNSNFYYLTGWSEPSAIALISPEGDTLFLPHRNARREIYEGKHIAPEDTNAVSVTGFDAVQGPEKFEAALGRALELHERLYTIAPAGEVAKLKALFPFREIRDGAPLIAPLRMRKSPAEIEAIRHATEVSMAAHLAAWKRLAAGVFEYQAAATFTSTLLDAGCEGHAYEPIFGSGPNSTTLHYNANSRRMDAGELIVIDAAAKCGGYTTDITRTIPISGKFTPRQREIYNLVLAAQQAVIDAIKPGVPAADLTRIAREYIDKHGGKDQDGKPLSHYLPHGVSHPVGLDVHDANVMTATLQAGMVVTVEPGLYFPAENLGVRIEDTVLVTETGATVLSGALPRSPEEVEKALAK